MPDRETAIPWPDWKITRHLGQGSFGNVYEIERSMYGHRETSALKVIRVPENDSVIEELRAEGCDNREILRRLDAQKQSVVREYAVMADMKGCTNIVYCDDLSENLHPNGLGWDIYIKMELLTALPRALGTVISEGQVLRVARGIGNALTFCEKQGLMHRDIKPQNIFVAKDGNCKLGDFGTAKAVRETMAGTRTGTYKYMAPEVYHNRPYGSRADLYSLGMVLYWMLNERRTPFLPLPPAAPGPEEEEAAVKRRFRGERLPPPAHGSEGLKKLVLRACSYNPEDRFRSAADFLRALDALPPEKAADERREIEDPDATVRVTRADEKRGAGPEGKRGAGRTADRTTDSGLWRYKGGEDYESSAYVSREEKSVAAGRLKINLGSSAGSAEMEKSIVPPSVTLRETGVSRLKISMSKSGKSTADPAADRPGSETSGSEDKIEPGGNRLKIKMKKN